MGKKANKKIDAQVISVLGQAFQTSGYGILKAVDQLLLREELLSKEVEALRKKVEDKESQEAQDD